MGDEITLFDGKHVLWDADKETWSVVDVVAALTQSEDPHTYWRVLKKRLKDEGNQTVTNCNALKMRASDGKMRVSTQAPSSKNAANRTC